MRIGLASAVLARLLVAAGCGGHSSQDAKRKAVTQYIERVDAVEQQLRFPLLKIERTYRNLSAHPGTLKKFAPQFATAEATLNTLQTRLRLIDAPPDARRLRTLLVGLIGSQAELVHELTTLVNFLPAFDAALKPLVPADARLKKALAAVSVPKPKPPVASNGTWPLAVTLVIGPHTLTATQTDTTWNLVSVLSSSVSVTVYTQPARPRSRPGRTSSRPRRR